MNPTGGSSSGRTPDAREPKQARKNLSFDETIILVLVLAFVGAIGVEILAAVFIKGFRDTAAGLITATGAVLSLPVTAYIGLRFTREIRQNNAENNAAHSVPQADTGTDG